MKSKQRFEEVAKISWFTETIIGFESKLNSESFQLGESSFFKAILIGYRGPYDASNKISF